MGRGDRPAQRIQSGNVTGMGSSGSHLGATLALSSLPVSVVTQWAEQWPLETHVLLETQNVTSFENRVFGDVFG